MPSATGAMPSANAVMLSAKAVMLSAKAAMPSASALIVFKKAFMPFVMAIIFNAVDTLITNTANILIAKGFWKGVCACWVVVKENDNEPAWLLNYGKGIL